MLPTRPEEFSVAWLSSALRALLTQANAEIVAVRAHWHATPGQTAETILIEPTYDREHPSLPTRLFGKATARDGATRELAKSMDLYRREVAFYRQAGDDVGLPVPHCYYAEFEPSTYEFVLLLEDLSAGVCPSWGITTAQAEDALERLPAFHARWWNQPAAKHFDWAIQLEERTFWDQWKLDLESNFGIAEARVGADIPAAFSATIEATLTKYQAFLDHLETRPFALVHGDYHFKQIFFPRPDGAGRFAVFDWQFPYVAPGPWDVARCMALTLPTAARRSSQDRLLDRYLQALRQHGVIDYRRADLLQDVRSGCLINLMIHTNALGATDLDILDKEASGYGMRWQSVAIDRVVDTASDFGVLPFLHSL
jgi:Ecdysteroid kinase-like family